MFEETLADFLTGKPKGPTEQAVQGALNRYFAMKTVDDVSTRLINRYLPEQPLQQRNLMLDNALKAKALGLPQDTSQFNEDLNMGHAGIMGALGIELNRRVPSPPVQPFIKKRAPVNLPDWLLEELEHGIESSGRGAVRGGSAVLRRVVGGI